MLKVEEAGSRLGLFSDLPLPAGNQPGRGFLEVFGSVRKETVRMCKQDIR